MKKSVLGTTGFTVFQKNGPFVISSYLCFDSYKFHENFQQYIEDVLLHNALLQLLHSPDLLPVDSLRSSCRCKWRT